MHWKALSRTAGRANSWEPQTQNVIRKIIAQSRRGNTLQCQLGGVWQGGVEKQPANRPRLIGEHF
jgi:hypothetical protein